MKQKLVLWSFNNYIANILNLKSYLLFGGGTTRRSAKDIRKNKVVVFLRDPEKDFFFCIYHTWGSIGTHEAV